MISETQALEDYGAIEQAYEQRRWQEVLSLAPALRDLLDGQEDRLRPRLLLLEGHAQLHGRVNPEAAGNLYRQVLSSGDATLRQLAAEALATLAEPMGAPMGAPEADGSNVDMGAADPFPFAAVAVGDPPAGMETAAMPWLVDQAAAAETGAAVTDAAVTDAAESDAAESGAPESAATEVSVVNDPMPLATGPAAGLRESVVDLEPAGPQPTDPGPDRKTWPELARGLLRVQLD